MSLIIPLALKSISTAVPPIVINGEIDKILVNNEITYIFGFFDNITGVDRKNIASINNNSKTITNFYQNGTDLGIQYDAALMKRPDNTDSIVVRSINLNNEKIIQLDKTTGNILSSGPSYAGVRNIFKFFIDPYINNSEIFAIGAFQKIGTFTKNGFAKFNNNLSVNSTWTCSPNPIYTVYALCSSHLSTHIYAGGEFNTIKGIARKRIARIRKTDGAVDTSFTYTPTLNGNNDVIYSMDLSSNGRLFVGGVWASTTPIFRCLNTNGTLFLDLTGNIPSLNYSLDAVRNIKINSFDQKIYTSLISYESSDTVLFRFNSNGSLDTTFNSPSGYVVFSNQNVSSLINFDFDNTNGLISVGGRFDTVNGNSVSNFAYLSSDGSFVL